MKLIEITEAGGPEVLKVSQGKMPECGENDAGTHIGKVILTLE